MGQNILLCPKDQEDCDKMFIAKEESSSDEFTEDETNYSTNQEEMVFLTRKIKGAKIEEKINVGAQLIHILRDLVGESLGEYLVDLRFQLHITLFQRNEMNVTEREQLGQSLEEFGSSRGVSTEPDVRECHLSELRLFMKPISAISGFREKT